MEEALILIRETAETLNELIFNRTGSRVGGELRGSGWETGRLLRGKNDNTVDGKLMRSPTRNNKQARPLGDRRGI